MARGKRITKAQMKKGAKIVKPIVNKARVKKTVKDLKGLPRNIINNLTQEMKKRDPVFTLSVTKALKPATTKKIKKSMKSKYKKYMKRSSGPKTGKGSTIMGYKRK